MFNLGYVTKLIGLFAFALLLTSCTQAPSESHLTGHTMGTTYNVKFVNSGDVNEQQLHDDIDAALVKVNALMSTYDPQSELSRFNQWHSDAPFALSPETLKVMREAKRLGKLSYGVLDVTVGPLVNLWGFGPDAKPDKRPSKQTIAEVQARTGLDKLILLDDSAKKSENDLYVDLSTIAKGYGVDVVAELLDAQGLHDYLVEVGGEMRVSGHKASGIEWRIAIEKPVSTERAVQEVISIGTNAIATSGDYRNYFEEEGVRYSHLIDPRTGAPVTHNLVAVTVVHPSSMTADGLATALIILGKDEALNVALQNDLAVLMITRENGEFKEYTTPKFEPFIDRQ
ncbi:MAG: FAD:protein FMN transferase ApbE [Alteromonadaceae bacterium]|uniref:FAD:protein FMN transferase n=1 Tax=Paraglaciecola chathamensis TaxID=368405 RepID=UPI000C456146|nr:FAD:protein FMN transferase [Paraglaciecola agarilytica]MBN24840.1 FAD:protein FMN transferase ApbE [Alteromonadaceae bacterium]|tara:strand:+ start:56795 stop:57817 length:1023 start_codon:yes stop_codon:yes gene_type:complete